MNTSEKFVLKRIQEVQENNKNKLSLHGFDLNHLPSELTKLNNIQELDLGFNKFDTIPDQIYKLSSLTKLDLKGNNISEISREILKLKNLKSLYIDDNEIAEIPSFLFDANNLEIINFANNPIQNVPDEIYNKRENVYEEVRNYFSQVKNYGIKKIYEGKLIILGGGGVGKTTLANKLINKNYKVPTQQDTTRGMDVLKYCFQSEYKGEKINFNANIWDFGGQEIYHTTHQFFLTQRSLYVLVLDNRQENDNLDYWLTITSILGGKSKIIIVVNEREERIRDINEISIKKHFPNVSSIVNVNFADNSGLETLTKKINEQLCQLKHVGKNLPKKWIDVKEKLEVNPNELISFDEFEGLCIKHKIKNQSEILFLSKFLHDLGIILHFQDDIVLYNAIILNPKWGTKAVYSVLESKNIIKQQGAFTSKQFSEILLNNNYPKSTHSILINLMKRFELCYDIEITESSFLFGFIKIEKIGKNYIAPQLLEIDAPEISFEFYSPIAISYNYEVLPPGIITRLIVRLHSYIKENCVWKEGVLLTWKNSTALVTQDKIKREINIICQGENDKLLMSIIRNNINVIHNSFNSLQVETLVPCNCSECKYSVIKHHFKLSILRQASIKNVSDLACYRSFKKINIKELLIYLDEYKDLNRVSKEISIYTLYSPKDKFYKEYLEVSLLSLKNYGVKLNDRSKISPGSLIRNQIEKDLDNADIILLLLSSDFISSNFFRSKLMNKIIEKSKNEKVILIPIVARPCNWEDTNIKSFLTLPRNLNAISTYEDKDIIYLLITREIKEVILRSRYGVEQ